MNILFIYNNLTQIEYRKELKKSFDFFKNNRSVRIINSKKLNENILNKIDVVIYNSIDIKWRKIIFRKKIILLEINKADYKKKFVDIIIDCFSNKKNTLIYNSKNIIHKKSIDDFNLKEIINIIVKLKWDSKFWGFPIAFIATRFLTENIIFRVNKFLKSQDIKMVQYLCNCHDRYSVKLAEKNNYGFKDIRITFEKKIQRLKNIIVDSDKSLSISIAKRKDLKILKSISKKNYLESRYYFDEKFAKKKISIFYTDWITKAVKGTFDDECIVLLKNKKIIGFCTIRYSIDKSLAHIGLFGIEKSNHGKGYGYIFLNMIFNKMNSKKIFNMRVVTQGRNYAAQRLYQKAGFLIFSTELWYHKWIY